MKNLKLTSALGALLLGTLAPVAVQAGPWSVRVAAAYLQTVDESSNAVVVNIEDKLIPEFDVSYSFNEHWDADLVLTIPQEHSVKGTASGSFKHLPPTLLAKYKFSPIGGLRPYVGAGVNFTLIFDEDIAVGPTKLKLDSFSVGPALQTGFDWALNDKWSLNLDVKKVLLRTDVTTGSGAFVTEARLDPWIYSAGLRYAF